MEDWWARLGAPLPAQCLPRDAFSVSRGGLLCGCFLYTMELKGGKGALISHTICNPDRRLAGFRAALEMMQDIKEYGNENGYIALMCLSNSRLLESIYLDVGFKLAEPGTNLFILA